MVNKRRDIEYRVRNIKFLGQSVSLIGRDELYVLHIATPGFLREIILNQHKHEHYF
jgi:hypothetical protein